MCGIVGILGHGPCAGRLVEALKRLEYRGYDSAGIATLNGGAINRRRAKGKIRNLEARLDESPLAGAAGIGHTRWATHGAPSETNAHPHATERVAVVHNGIIENYAELKEELEARGDRFETETDTEAVTRLLDSLIADGATPEHAVAEALGRLEGAFALAMIFAGAKDRILVARQGTPLAIGYGEGESEGEMFVASDSYALAPLTSKLSYLEDGDWAAVRRDGVEIRDRHGARVAREIKRSGLSAALIGKGEYRHFMLKEIHEQPQVIGQTLSAFANPATGRVTLPELPFDLAGIERVTLVACGTAFYAGHTARYWLEQIARLPVDLDIASEFRYREAPMAPGQLAIFISQSGETLDTLEALRFARSQDQRILSIINQPESSIARESDAVLHTLAGPEIGVASTKAFTTQLAVLACLTLALARARGTIGQSAEARLSHALREVPARAAEVLRHEDTIQAIAAEIHDSRDMLYMGRGPSFPIAMEGALKLKEISYIHAEGQAAGELKHGPIALIDETVPVVVIAPRDRWFDKTASNMQEVIARGGRVLLISDDERTGGRRDGVHWHIPMPAADPLAAPILYALPIQLLAYYVAVAKGTDVDQPRNLAKSVTVE